MSYLAKFRKKHGLSQEEFAEKLGFTTRAVSTWELGKVEPQPRAIAAIRGFIDEVEHDEKVIDEVADKIMLELLGV